MLTIEVITKEPFDIVFPNYETKDVEELLDKQDHKEHSCDLKLVLCHNRVGGGCFFARLQFNSSLEFDLTMFPQLEITEEIDRNNHIYQN